MYSAWDTPGINQGGFPHSEISGSKPVCGSPELIAAYHVLHRLLAPRHSPYALSSLTIRTRFKTLAAGGWRLAAPKCCPLPAACCRLSETRDCTACAWSEKTTVCRIFSCQRAATRSSAPPSHSIGSSPCWLAITRSPFQEPAFALARYGGQPSRRCHRAKVGGEYRARTGDLLVANQALSQLS